MFKKTKVKQILSMIFFNASNHLISKALNVSRNTVSLIREKGDNFDLNKYNLENYTDDQLYGMFFPNRFMRKVKYQTVDYNYVHNELKKVGVTLKLLWEEYVNKCKKENLAYCSYPTFVVNYEKYANNEKYTSHIVHKPGETIEVDWSGSTMSYLDRDNNKKITAYLFVACMPYSQKIYVEATTSMNQESWMNCNVNMLNFFGRAPLNIVCDNCKTAVISHPRWGDIELNEEYLTFCEYYGIVMKPANVRKPKEKASVEGSVGKIATKIIAKLRNETFYSLKALNEAILRELDLFNNTIFKNEQELEIAFLKWKKRVI